MQEVWLPDSIWEMMVSCWSVLPESRLDINQVRDALSRAVGDVDSPATGKQTPT